ncbi:MAG: flagellar basal body L-ring protein FlgH [Planctomycetaceae bacterium]|nr:flagellar basal body L-ring protein FlgH [Planctomycetaceae bacterium]
MMKKWKTAVLASLGTLQLHGTAPGEDLWQRRNPERAYLLSDTLAREVGDLLTLIISEDANVDQRDARALSKSAARSGGFDITGVAGGDLGSGAGNAALEAAASTGRDFDGSSSFRSARQFSDRVTLTVMDVLPNGNLVVSGRRMINVDRDQRELIVSGVVRPNDLNPDNTVHSRYVSELRVNYVGEGTDTKYTKPGWLIRIANRFSPF